MLRKPLAANSEPVPYRFTVKEWHCLGEAGLFDEKDRVELLDGEIIIMSPVGGRHAATVFNLIDLFGERNRRRYLVGAGNPIEADHYSEPLPDFVLVPRVQKIAKRHPATRDAYLVVEVSDTSLAHDRGRKYAKSGVVEYWIVNLKHDTIEVYRSPKGEVYREQSVAKAEDKIAPAALPDVELPVEEIIPPR